MNKIKVLIGDRQPAFREGLARLVTENRDMELIGHTGNGEELIALSTRYQPDVAVIDLALPKINGIEATRKLKIILPSTSVLVVSALDSQAYALSALRAGAAGFLTKDTPTQDLIKAVRLVNAGEGIIERRLGEDIIRIFAGQKEIRQGMELHPRELEVLKSTAKGLRNKEIAAALNISERTVQAHLSNIFCKMQVDSRTEAVLKALRSGWLDIADLR
ncbi:MAG TPA: response regulator transcription factor [Dehalococcoidales bacterium]|nr:response regulator transcription factor [Dehalococcoidales bacterium]